MCDCENMTSSLRDQKISEFFRTVLLRHANSEGAVSFDSLEAALASLGRSVPPEQLAKIRKKFDKDGSGLINLQDPEFILTVASLNVKDIGAIKDDILTSAFKIFDMVRNQKKTEKENYLRNTLYVAQKCLRVIYHFLIKFYFEDSDGKISLHEMRIVLSLFLPPRLQHEQESVESTLYSMDRARDGQVTESDFVRGVREAGVFRLTSYTEEIMLASLVVAGFVLYQMLSGCGMLPVIGFYDEGPLGA